MSPQRPSFNIFLPPWQQAINFILKHLFSKEKKLKEKGINTLNVSLIRYRWNDFFFFFDGKEIVEIL